MKCFLAAIVVLVASVAPTLAADEQKQHDDLIRNTMLCVRRAAVRLEPSGESPQDIAETTLWVCNTERLALTNWELQHHTLGNSNMEVNERGAAVAQVVGVRLCKKANDCFFSTVP